MDAQIDSRRYRTATVLALVGAGVMTFLALACIRQAWPRERAAAAETITTAFLLVAAIASARLATACVTAARQLHAESRTARQARALPLDPRTARPDPTSRRRAASLFLALAALIGPMAATAGATPIGHARLTTSEPQASLDDAMSPPGLPAPSFEGPSTTAAAGTPDFSLPDALRVRDDDARPTNVHSTERGADHRCDAPVPGWTPPATGDVAGCRLILGSAPGDRSQAHHVVLRGETLWAIAAAHLPLHSSPEQVAAALPGWLEANPGLTTHPDLLHAGDVLAIPTPFMTGADR